MNSPLDALTRWALLLLVASLFVHCAGPERSARSVGSLGPMAEARHRLLSDALDGLDFVTGRVRVRRAAAPPPDPHTLWVQPSRLLSQGRFYEAIAAAALAVRALPHEPRAYNSLAVALQNRGRLVEAEAALRTALDLSPRHPELRWRLALILQGQGRLGEAIAEWQGNLTTAPHHGPSHARLAVAFAIVGDFNRGRQHASRAEALGTPPPPQAEEILSAAEAPEVGSLGKAFLGSAAVRVDTGGTTQAAETILTASVSGQALVAGWNDLRQAGAGDTWRLGVAASSNGGTTWNDHILRSPLGLADDFEGDPMVAYDPRTGHQWVGGVLFGYVNQRDGELYLARRQPGSNNFLPAVSIHVDNFIDKPLLAAGPRPGLPATTRLYVAYNLGLHTSDDLGATWSALRTLDGGVGQHPRVGPNGELYVLYWDINLDYKLLRSTDGGATFGPPRVVATRLDLWSTAETSHVPGSFRVAPLACLAVDPNNGTLYVVYPDSTGASGGEENVDIYFTRSTDGGVSWTVPRVIHGDSAPPRDQFHPWLEVGSDGRLHLTYLDTRRTSQLDADPNAFLDVFYATSVDQGSSWSESPVTSQPFESQWATWPGFTDQFMGDYIGLAPAADGMHLLYPSTVNGNLDIFTQRLEDTLLFADGFESGDLSAWGLVVP